MRADNSRTSLTTSSAKAVPSARYGRSASGERATASSVDIGERTKGDSSRSEGDASMHCHTVSIRLHATKLSFHREATRYMVWQGSRATSCDPITHNETCAPPAYAPLWRWDA